MGNMGFGVMLHYLMGDDGSAARLRAAIGKRITAITLNDADDPNHLDIALEGGGISVLDDGQSCCESRYMTTDDTLADFVGATLTDIGIRNAPNVEDPYGEHEVQFLIVRTSLGDFTVETHNEHNGYYGGFAVVIRDLEDEGES